MASFLRASSYAPGALLQLPVAHLAAALPFYTDVLGFELLAPEGGELTGAGVGATLADWLSPGERVSATWNPSALSSTRARRHAAEVVGENADGTFVLQYADGGFDAAVPRGNIFAPGEAGTDGEAKVPAVEGEGATARCPMARLQRGAVVLGLAQSGGDPGQHGAFLEVGGSA
jgi:catechol 2,3-dioxygenase-like lactoylglutathione lyase family enzyme